MNGKILFSLFAKYMGQIFLKHTLHKNLYYSINNNLTKIVVTSNMV